MSRRLSFHVAPPAADALPQAVSLAAWLGLCALCAALGIAASFCIAAMVRLAGAPL